MQTMRHHRASAAAAAAADTDLVGGAEASALSLESEVGLLLTAILLTLPFLHIYKPCFSVHVAADSLLVARPIVGAPVAALLYSEVPKDSSKHCE
jgi:hypothetical protein